MKPGYGSIAAALAGAAIVVVALWLSRSIVPEVLVVPLETYSSTILLAVIAGAALLARSGHLSEAAALSVGAGGAWLLSEVHPLVLCQSELLFRPCAVSEIAWMALPGLGLVIVGSVLFFYRKRATPAH